MAPFFPFLVAGSFSFVGPSFLTLLWLFDIPPFFSWKKEIEKGLPPKPFNSSLRITSSTSLEMKKDQISGRYFRLSRGGVTLQVCHVIQSEAEACAGGFGPRCGKRIVRRYAGQGARLLQVGLRRAVGFGLQALELG